MKKSELILTFIQVPLDFIALVLAGFSAYALRFSEFFVRLRAPIFSFDERSYTILVGSVALGWIIIFAFSGLFTINPNRKLASDFLRIIYACTTGLALITIYIFFKGEFFNSRFIVLAAWALGIIYVAVAHLIVRMFKAMLYHSGLGLRQTIIFGANGVAADLAGVLQNRPALGYKIVEQFKQFDNSAWTKLDALKNGKKIDEIILASANRNNDEALELIDWCNENHVTFKYIADLFSTLSTNIAVYPIAGIPVVEIKRTRLDGWGRIIKTVVDFIGALFFIIILSPIMILVAIAVLIETGRPVIYKNERVGRGGEKFYLWKFRSMFAQYSIGPDFEKTKEALEFEKELIKKQSIKEGPVYKIKDDPRVTTVGCITRRWSLDELPQFFNVLFGHMSLVGPRPHQPREVKNYEKHHRAVLNIKPGITGLAQVSGRSDLEFEEEIRLDTFYMERWSLLLDFIILIKTPFVIIKKRKAL